MKQRKPSNNLKGANIKSGSELSKIRAKKNLEKAKGIAGEREKIGWVWIKKNKIVKQVHSSKLQEYLDDGFCIKK